MNFILENKAKKSGGDKYICEECDFNMYIPQTVSRNDGIVKTSLCINVSKDETENCYKFTLENKAKKSGGDKYQCDTIEKFNAYFPQSISRVDNIPSPVLFLEIN